MSPKFIMGFVGIFLLLGLPSVVPGSCPTCSGTGRVSSLPGMENLRILKTSAKELYTYHNPCEMFILFKYDVQVSIANDSPNVVRGFIEAIVKDAVTQQTVWTRPVYVEVPAKRTSHTTTLVLVFAVDPARVHPLLDFEISMSIPAGSELVCQTCDGTGKVSAINAFLISTLKELKPVEKPVEPPYIPPYAEE